MTARTLLSRGVLALGFAALLGGGSFAQSRDPTPQQQDIQNDTKDVRQDKRDLRNDRADRNAER
jgi:hypothetical protein